MSKRFNALNNKALNNAWFNTHNVALNNSFNNARKARLNNLFNSLDRDNDGVVTALDFENFATDLANHAKFDDTKRNSLRNNFNLNFNTYFKPHLNGNAATNEVFLNRLENSNRDQLRESVDFAFNNIFEALDQDHDGKINFAEYNSLHNYLGLNRNEKNLNAVTNTFNALDSDNDGFINKNEFVNAALDYISVDEPEHHSHGLFGHINLNNKNLNNNFNNFNNFNNLNLNAEGELEGEPKDEHHHHKCAIL